MLIVIFGCLQRTLLVRFDACLLQIQAAVDEVAGRRSPK